MDVSHSFWEHWLPKTWYITHILRWDNWLTSDLVTHQSESLWVSTSSMTISLPKVSHLTHPLKSSHCVHVCVAVIQLFWGYYLIYVAIKERAESENVKTRPLLRPTQFLNLHWWIILITLQLSASCRIEHKFTSISGNSPWRMKTLGLQWQWSIAQTYFLFNVTEVVHLAWFHSLHASGDIVYPRPRVSWIDSLKRSETTTF